MIFTSCIQLNFRYVMELLVLHDGEPQDTLSRAIHVPQNITKEPSNAPRNEKQIQANQECHIYSMQPALYSILYVSHTYIHISKKVRSAVLLVNSY